MAITGDPHQTAPQGAVWSGSSVFALIFLVQLLGLYGKYGQNVIMNTVTGLKAFVKVVFERQIILDLISLRR